MKKLFLILLSAFQLFSFSAFEAQATTIKVNSRNFTSEPTQRRAVTLTLTSPGPLITGPWLLAGDSVRIFTDTNGVGYFSNVLAANYRLDIAGTPGRSFPISVFDTNAVMDAAALVNTTNFNTSFYTATQVDALLAALPTGTNGGISPNVLTNYDSRFVVFGGQMAVSNGFGVINGDIGILDGQFNGDAGGLTNLPAANLTGTLTNNTTGSAATVQGFVRLSDYMSSDTDLTLGVTNVGTDRTAAIQALFDAATNRTATTIKWDVAVSHSGIRIHDNTRIEFEPGAGMRLMGGANRPLISNSLYGAGTNQANWATAPNLAIVPRNNHIQLVGAGILDGNTTNQLHNTASEGWTVGVRFFNVDNLLLDGINVQAARTFAYHFSNVRDSKMIGCSVEGGTIANQDGLHYHSVSNVLIKDFVGHSRDDLIGINADDLREYAGQREIFLPFAAPGPIYDLTLQGLRFTGTNGAYAIRILSGTNRIDRITLKDITGTYGGHLLHIDNFSDPAQFSTGTPDTYLRENGPGNVGTVTLENVDLTISELLTYKQTSIFVSCKVENLIIRNATFRCDDENVMGDRPFINFKTSLLSTSRVDNVLLENVTFIMPPNENSFPTLRYIRTEGATRIGNFVANNINVVRRSTTLSNRLHGYFINVENGHGVTISNLTINGLNAPYLYGEISGLTNMRNVMIKNSTVPPLVRGGVNYVSQHATIPDAWNVTAPANTATAPFLNGEWRGATNVTFSVVVNPSASHYTSIGTRLTYWPITGGNLTGYRLTMTPTAIYLAEMIAPSGNATLSNRTATLTAGLEYRMQLSASNDTYRAYLQRLDDDAWLGADGTFSAGRKPCIVTNDSTWGAEGRYQWVETYDTTGNIPVRFREINRW